MAEALFSEFPEVAGVSSTDSWDGANLRIVMTRDDPELIDRIMRSVFEIIDKHGMLGEIIPEIAMMNEDEI